MEQPTLLVHCFAGVWLDARNQVTKNAVVLQKPHGAQPGLVSEETLFYLSTRSLIVLR